MLCGSSRRSSREEPRGRRLRLLPQRPELGRRGRLVRCAARSGLSRRQDYADQQSLARGRCPSPLLSQRDQQFPCRLPLSPSPTKKHPSPPQGAAPEAAPTRLALVLAPCPTRKQHQQQQHQHQQLQQNQHQTKHQRRRHQRACHRHGALLWREPRKKEEGA